jgi:hypothetical protein
MTFADYYKEVRIGAKKRDELLGELKWLFPDQDKFIETSMVTLVELSYGINVPPFSRAASVVSHRFLPLSRR